MVHFENDWDDVLAGEFDKPYYQQLRRVLAHEYRTCRIYPAMQEIFTALKLTPYHNVRVVILGQDPYHGPNQAHGLAFSVKKGTPIPPSLVNIFTELKHDCGCYIPNHGCLEKWAMQGVLLLNTVLTVRAGSANSHRGLGWETFTDRVVSLLNERKEPIVFLLWGANARAKASHITAPQHRVLTAAHPSPFSASSGFFGCRHFSKANTIISQAGLEEIDWQIESDNP